MIELGRVLVTSPESTGYLRLLKSNLGFSDYITLVRRAIYIYRRVLDHFQNDCVVRLYGRSNTITFKNLTRVTLLKQASKANITIIEQIFYELDNIEVSPHVLKIIVPLDLNRVILTICNRRGYTNIAEVTNESLILFQIVLILIFPNSSLVIEGSERKTRIPVIKKWEKRKYSDNSI